MGHWLCRERRGQRTGTRMRFDPADWTVDFPRPMMAAATTPGADTLRVDAVFYHRDALAGLIWDAADLHDHPLLRRETARDFRGCRLSFQWRSAGLVPLDAVNGPVLTIEGRDAGGAARTWYVRLWNYASGAPEDAAVALDFANLSGGFLLPAEADPVSAGDVDRMFVSLPPAGFDPVGGGFAGGVEAWAELSGMRCDGPGAVLEVGDATLPEHTLRIANGYDDCYHLTPERVLPLGEGTIGAVETKDSGFTAELAGPSAALAAPVVEETSAECRAELGDRRCRVAMRGRRRLARVVDSDGAMLTLDAVEPVADAYGWGVLRWLEGPNCGLDSAVAISDGTGVTLRRAPPFPVAAGTLVRIEEGCDKVLATCAGRFANAANFRGEPYLPGIDLLTRYPGG